MHSLTKAALVLMALSTAACTNPDRFANGGAGAGDPSSLAASDPTSPAYFSQTVGDRVVFEVDQSTLTQEAMFVLDGQVQWLMANSDYLAVIEGHADEQGTREYNLALGNRRANAVREYLISRGIPANRITTVSYGKERPIAICSDETCYSQNRRAVTVISVASFS